MIDDANGLEPKAIIEDFLEQYNRDIDDAEAEIESGNYLDQNEVEKIFADRRENLRRY